MTSGQRWMAETSSMSLSGAICIRPLCCLLLLPRSEMLPDKTGNCKNRIRADD